MAFSGWEAGRLAGRLTVKLAGMLAWRGGKFSHPKSDDSMMLVMMIGWQFLARRPGGRLALKNDGSLMLVMMIGLHFLAGVAGRGGWLGGWL